MPTVPVEESALPGKPGLPFQSLKVYRASQIIGTVFPMYSFLEFNGIGFGSLYCTSAYSLPCYMCYYIMCEILNRMESTEKCEAVIQHFNGKYIKTPPGVAGRGRFQFSDGINTFHSLFPYYLCPVVIFPVPTEPLLCKFADGGQRKRQSQGKYLLNGRPWTRDGETVRNNKKLVGCWFFNILRGLIIIIIIK